jgi:nitroimidazol reductase NimA-like FMN-containing flavoprotein (pyridoxamine 5'-phosphate oxidase superfamily)
MIEDPLRAEILSYISSHNVCRIAISDGKSPSAYSMYYLNVGLKVYFESDPVSQKVQILRANPKISMAIDEDYADWRNIKGAQINGRANILDETASARIRRAYLEKFPIIEEIGGLPAHHVFIEVVPEKVYFMDFSKKFGNRAVFYPDEDKADNSRLSW